MSGDNRDAWIAVFQENQRQLIKAHDEFQRTLSEGHKHFLDAMGESQRRLAQAIAGDAETEVPPKRLASAPVTKTRKTPAVIDVARSGELWPALRKDRAIGVVPDDFGVAQHVVSLLKARGWLVSVLKPGETADVLVFLGSLIANERALAQGKGLELAAKWLNQKFDAVILVGDLGGRFGFDQFESYRAVHIGLMDMAIQSAVPARFIDLDVGFRKPEDAAQDLVAELLGGGGESPVGLPEDGRVHLVEADAKVELTPHSYDQDTLLIVSSSAVDIARVRELWTGKIGGVGFASDQLDSAKRCDLYNPMNTYEAVDDVRRQCGPFTHILLLEPMGNWAVDRALHALAPLHAILASTAADPVRGILASIVRDDPAASLLSWVFLAEQERRGHEAKLKIVMSNDQDVALLELFQSESDHTMWSID